MSVLRDIGVDLSIPLEADLENGAIRIAQGIKIFRTKRISCPNDGC